MISRKLSDFIGQFARAGIIIYSIFTISCIDVPLESDFKRSFDSLKISADIEVTLPDDVAQPELIKWKDDFIYVLDFHEMRISKFDEDWQRVAIIGNGKGRGPGEAMTITDFSVDDNYVWVVASDKSSAMKFDLEGKLLGEYSLPSFSLRITTQPDGYISMGIGRDFLFTSHDTDDDTTFVFGKLDGLSYQNSISFDGEIESNNGKQFYYLPKYFSRLYRISIEDRSEIEIIKLPDIQERPDPDYTSTSSVKAPDTRVKNMGLSIYNGIVYIATFDKGITKEDRQFEGWQFYIDLFDSESGSYIKSFRFPGFFTNFSIGENKIYAIAGNKKVYEIRLNE